jgi:hypothetical protein
MVACFGIFMIGVGFSVLGKSKVSGWLNVLPGAGLLISGIVFSSIVYGQYKKDPSKFE